MSQTHERNPGCALRREWFEDVQINRTAAERRAAAITSGRTVKKNYQAAWLLRAVQCIDLTTLAGDDTPGRVRRLCAKARQPVRPDLMQAMGVDAVTTGAVCVYPTMVPHAVRALEGSGIPVASVATGFPSGLTPLPQRLAEIRYAVEQGAREIDIVITREHVLLGNWQALHDEVCAHVARRLHTQRRVCPALRIGVHDRGLGRLAGDRCVRLAYQRGLGISDNGARAGQEERVSEPQRLNGGYGLLH